MRDKNMVIWKVNMCWKVTALLYLGALFRDYPCTGLILGLRRYFVTTYLIDWEQA